MELLFSTSVTVWTVVSLLTMNWVSPFIIQLHIGTGSGTILEGLGSPSPVLVIVIEGTSIALSTQSGGPLT